MIINFFEIYEGLDIRAIKGGIYQVELLKKGIDESLSLYIGESEWVIERCGRHLYAFYDNPNYFGLTRNDLEDNNFILKFTLLKELKDKKSILGVGKFKKVELEYIKYKEPITQLRTSDRQIKDIKEKVDKVQDAMKKIGFK